MNDWAREAVEDRTRTWLDASYLRGVVAMRERAPIFDANGQPQRMTAYDFQELQRKLEIFRWFDRFDFGSFLDVGSGFDIVPQLVARRYGVPGYFCDLVHSMNLPYGGDAFGRLDHAVTVNLVRLPFADGAFDLVLASEVLEHLVRPVEAIAELLRISRKYLVMTSLEALALGPWQRFWSHHRVDPQVPHVERNFFLLAEFAALFGADFHHENLFYSPTLPANPLLPPAEQEAGYARLADLARLEEALATATTIRDHRTGAMGILLVKPKPGATLRAPIDGDRGLMRWLIDEKARLERTWQRLFDDMDAGRAEFAARDRPIAADLLARLVCPDCRGTLERVGAGLACTACRARFAGEYGVPILYPTRDRDVLSESVERICNGDPQRRATVARLARRLRRNEGAPSALRRWLWRLERTVGI